MALAEGKGVLRVAKLTDYATVILQKMALAPGHCWSSGQLAEELGLNNSTVSKILKRLCRERVLTSQRGAHGGYQFGQDPSELTLSTIVSAMEGPIALTSCAHGPDHCQRYADCGVREPWQQINHVIHAALSAVRLSDLAESKGKPNVQ